MMGLIAPPPPQEDAIVQQFEQQFGVQFQMLYRTELHFMRLVCQPTKEQYERVSAKGQAGLKASVRKFAVDWRGMQEGRRVGDTSSDPRASIADAVLKSVRTTLTPEQTALYEKEIEQRASARKRMVVQNLVANVDKLLVLTDEQRGQLAKVLEKKWNESWNEPQRIMYAAQYFPQMPDADILPLLNENQKTVWRGIPRGNVMFGFNPGILQGIDIGDEVWVEPPSNKAEEKK